ncbi:hypothetical protein ACJX0J_039337 [Zea mays]
MHYKLRIYEVASGFFGFIMDFPQGRFLETLMQNGIIHMDTEAFENSIYKNIWKAHSLPIDNKILCHTHIAYKQNQAQNTHINMLSTLITILEPKRHHQTNGRGQLFTGFTQQKYRKCIVGHLMGQANEIEHNKSMRESMQAPLNLKTLVFGLMH